MSELIHQSDRAATDPTDPAHPQAGQPHTAPSRLSQLIGGLRTAMLTSVAPDGGLESRPMSLLELDAEGALWFFCERAGDDAALESRYRRLNLSFSDELRSVFVSITGRGELLLDAERIRQLWSRQARAMLPQGMEPDRLAVLKVTPERSECWESATSALVPGASVSVGGE